MKLNRNKNKSKRKRRIEVLKLWCFFTYQMLFVTVICEWSQMNNNYVGPTIVIVIRNSVENSSCVGSCSCKRLLDGSPE